MQFCVTKKRTKKKASHILNFYLIQLKMKNKDTNVIQNVEKSNFQCIFGFCIAKINKRMASYLFSALIFNK